MAPRAAASSPTVTSLRRDAAELPALRLVVVAPDGRSNEITLGMQTAVLGSSEDADVVLDDPEISRAHASIAVTSRGVRLRDLGSKNGTFVCGVHVLEALLSPGDEIGIGRWRMRLESSGEPTLVPLSTAARFGEALGSSVAMRALFAQLERVARSDETVLLVGESGTGKELLGRAIHEASARTAGPFQVFDCTAVAPALAESELFGHKRGAFTGATADRVGVLEQASGGTLFIDELGELPPEVQPKLLRAIEERQLRPVGANDYRGFDARIVAATHRDLRARVREGHFRQDLFFRVAVLEARVPPLREHKEDIRLLVERFLASHDPPRSFRDVPSRTLELLEAHDWPGNVRELRNAVARLLLFPDADAVVGGHGAPEPEVAPREGDPLWRLPLRDARDIVVERFEESYIRRRLREHGGNVTRTAQAIGVSRQIVHRLMDRYGIRRS